MRIRRPPFLLSFSLVFMILASLLATCGSSSSTGGSTSSTTGCKSSQHASSNVSQAPVVEPAAFSTTQRKSGGAAKALQDVSIGLGYIPDIQFAPFYVAQSKGYYNAAGLNVTFHHGIVNDLIGSMVLGHDNFVFAHLGTGRHNRDDLRYGIKRYQ